MTLNVSSFSVGVTTGTITGINVIMPISTPFGVCTADIAGTAAIKYTNFRDLLQFIAAGDTMSVTSATDPTGEACVLAVHKGDPITLSSGTGGLVVTGKPTNPISISQP